MSIIKPCILLVFAKFMLWGTTLQAQELDTLVLQPDGTIGKDAILYDLKPDNNYGTHPQINAQAWTNSGRPQTMRGLLQFDLSDLPDEVTIVKIYLSLYHHVANNNPGHSQLGGSNVSSLERVSEAWDENTVTWNSQPPTDDTNTMTIPASVREDQDYLDLDVTNLMVDSNGNLLDNHGFMLVLKTELHYRSLVFASSDVADAAKRPKLVVLYGSNCMDSPNPTEIGIDTTLCQGQHLLLDATVDGGVYLWQDGSIESSLLATTPGEYWVEISKDGCSTLRTFNLEELDCEVVLTLPNVFTPNGDGMNDSFVPIESKGIISMNTTIQSRLGKKVFSTNRLLIEWDATLNNGKKATAGVYFYVIDYMDMRGNQTRVKGQVTILR